MNIVFTTKLWLFYWTHLVFIRNLSTSMGHTHSSTTAKTWSRLAQW